MDALAGSEWAFLVKPDATSEMLTLARSLAPPTGEVVTNGARLVFRLPAAAGEYRVTVLPEAQRWSTPEYLASVYGGRGWARRMFRHIWGYLQIRAQGASEEECAALFQHTLEGGGNTLWVSPHSAEYAACLRLADLGFLEPASRAQPDSGRFMLTARANALLGDHDEGEDA